MSSQVEDLIRQLREVFHDEDYNETDYLRPTPEREIRLRCLLQDAAKSMPFDFPIGTVMADGDGGLRVEWIRDGRELRLMLPPPGIGREYIYYEDRPFYDAEFSVTPDNLRLWLAWLVSSSLEHATMIKTEDGRSLCLCGQTFDGALCPNVWRSVTGEEFVPSPRIRLE